MKRLLEAEKGPAGSQRVQVTRTSGTQIGHRALPQLLERDAKEAVLISVQVGALYVPAELVLRTVHCVVRSKCDQHARLKTFMALERVCQGLFRACRHAMLAPELRAFRRQARSWDAHLLKNLYPDYQVRDQLLDWRWGPDSKRPREVEVDAPEWLVVRMKNISGLGAFAKLDVSTINELQLQDTTEDVLTPLLAILGKTGLPKLETLEIGRQPQLREEQNLIDKCPFLSTLVMVSLPETLPAALKCLQVDHFNSKGRDATACAGELKDLRELYIEDLEDDSAALLKHLAPRLHTLHIGSARPLLEKTLADLEGAPLQKLMLPKLRVPGPEYLSLQTLPGRFPELSDLMLQFWLTDTQQDARHFSQTLVDLACLPGLRSFSLRLSGVPLQDAFRDAIRQSLLQALHANRDLLMVKVQLADDSLLTDPAWTQRALANQCYAPR